MFTGIVERAARVVAAEHSPAGSRIEVDLEASAAGVSIGASIAIDGCCLTVVALAGERAAFDVAPETLSRTNAADWRVGSRVNVERALRFGDRLDGHLVTGHIDAVATVRSVVPRGIELDVEIELPESYRRFVVEKGSVTLSGVSLTVAAITPDGFRVMLVPHTAAVTTLGALAPGSRVNFEADAMGKWVARWLEPYLAPREQPLGGIGRAPLHGR